MTAPLLFRWLIAVCACLGLGAVVGTAAVARFGGLDVGDPVDLEAVVPAGAGMAVGLNREAPALRVFGDYECAACRDLEDFAGDTLRTLARNGRIRFVYHHAPLRGHRRGPDAAAVAYCAERAGFAWQAHTALFSSAPRWGTGPDGPDRLLTAVAAAVPDTAGLRGCAAEASTRDRVRADRAAADRLGLQETPAVYFRDRRLHLRSWRALVRYVTEETRPSKG